MTRSGKIQRKFDFVIEQRDMRRPYTTPFAALIDASDLVKNMLKVLASIPTPIRSCADDSWRLDNTRGKVRSPAKDPPGVEGYRHQRAAGARQSSPPCSISATVVG